MAARGCVDLGQGPPRPTGEDGARPRTEPPVPAHDQPLGRRHRHDRHRPRVPRARAGGRRGWTGRRARAGSSWRSSCGATCSSSRRSCSARTRCGASRGSSRATSSSAGRIPWIVSIVVAGVLSLLVVHAMLALRKFPIDYRQYRGVPRSRERDEARRHHALVVAGRHRLRAVLPRLDPPVRDADAARADRSVRERRPGLERALLAALPGAAVRGRAARRHRPVPAGGEVGLVRRRRMPTSRGDA